MPLRNRTHTLTARDLHAHADSGHDTYDDSRAHGGHAVYLAGGPVAHSSKKLAIVTDSTLYSEYVQLHACGREVETIWNFLQDIRTTIDPDTYPPYRYLSPLILSSIRSVCTKFCDDS
jgi:hypothetical protein